MIVTPILIRLALFALPFVVFYVWYRQQLAKQKEQEAKGSAPPDAAEPINRLLLGGVLALIAAIFALGLYEAVQPVEEDYRRSYEDAGGG